MRKANFKRGFSGLLSACMLMSAVCVPMTVSAEKDTDSQNKFYSQTALDNWTDTDTKNGIFVDLSGKDVTLSVGKTMTFDAAITADGRYRVLVKYRSTDTVSSLDSRIELSVDGVAQGEVSLPVLWADIKRNILDRSGNEVIPMQESVSEQYYGFLQDIEDINKPDLTLELKAGAHSFSLKTLVNSFEISEIVFLPVKDIPNYGEYIAKHNDKKKVYTETAFEAEEYSLKSDSYIRGENVQKNNISPYVNLKKKINVLSGGSWNTSGQKVLWEFSVKKSGLYRITLNYKQNSNTNIPIFRSIEIDGEIPFEEWRQYRFANTGTSEFVADTLKVDGKDAWVYLEKGEHTLAMGINIGFLKEPYQQLLTLVSEMNDFGSILKKLAAGSKDTNRTWDMKSYMPSAKSDIIGFAERIDGIYKNLCKTSDEQPVYADDLKYASEQLRDMADKENQIPNNTEMLCLGDSSATTYIISVISSITSQSLSVDKFYLHGENAPNVKKLSFWRSVWDSIKKFVYSFTSDAVAQDLGTSDSKKTDELVVWSGDSLLGISILQQLLDETYNKEKGTDIRIAIMQNEQRLILSNAVGNNPDVVIQAGVGIPFEYAIRGAAKNLLEFDDFLPFYTSQYSLESLVSMYCDKGVYGAVESRDFSVMYYRKDILDVLDLKVPDTWDDVKEMMPTLLRNSMNISHPLAGGGSYGLGNAGSFIYQNGGSIYSDDGAKTVLDSEYTVQGLTEMTEMFTIYGAQDSVASFFNSFRYGQIPIGFGGFGIYLQLTMAAPELGGLWDIAPMPGTLQEDGTVARYSVCNSTSCMIFDNTKKDAAAWDFLKWWLSADTQAEYSRRRQTGYGTQYLWNTANKQSFETLPFTAEQKDVIRSQFEWQKETVNHPAAYLIAREIGNTWNQVVLNNKTLIDCINNSVILSNREIERKLQEFGYMDEKGNLVKDYTTNATRELLKMKEEKQ